MTPFAVYRLDTGRIVSAGGVTGSPEGIDEQVAAQLLPWGDAEHAVLAVAADPEAHFVATLGDRPTVQERPPLVVSLDRTSIAADGIDEAVLTGLPDPCEVVIDADDPTVETTVAQVTGGGFVFTAEDPGTYVVEVRRFPFLPFQATIEATAP